MLFKYYVVHMILNMSFVLNIKLEA